MRLLPRSRHLPEHASLTLALLCALFAPALAAERDGGPDTGAAAQARDIDRVTVFGQRYLPEYGARSSSSATKTDTDLVDVPQAVTVITDKLIADQAMTSLMDTLRYMPGVGTAQGEGNRDTPVLRGISSTADFFVDGIRDDVQYIRDVYNLERVEALKGPNAMIFGRGGSGGVINRVTRQADGADHRSGSLQLGSHQRRRGTLDVGGSLGEQAGFRVNAMYEDSESFRDGFELNRYGINPTVGIDLSPHTRLRLSYERFHDERVADRGISSANGRPLDVDPSTFFGNPESSPVEATVDAFDAVLEHSFENGLSLRNHLRWADYDKFYQNVYPRSFDAATKTVTLAGYNNTTARQNLLNQTDLTWHTSTGKLDHTLLAGAEFGRQVTDNLRMTGYFGGPGTSTSVQVPLADPRTSQLIEFQQSATDSDNHGVAKVAAIYLQDQIEFSPRWHAIVGFRYDDFRVDLRNNRDGTSLSTHDGLLSPRAGLVFNPIAAASLYASYSVAHQPRAGEQLASLKLDSAALDPETFHNLEVGAKWDIRPDLSASLAVYRLKRGNVAVVDPADATRLILVDGQVAEGIELGIAGRISPAWQVMGGYAYQTGELGSMQSGAAVAGNRLAQLPRHSASLWNRYDIIPAFGLGLGIIHRGAIYANVDNAVELPGFTRLDAALYWTINPVLQLQLNVENLGNKRYFASAHSNSNISPGSPRSAWVNLNHDF